jgi:hypothetical protein
MLAMRIVFTVVVMAGVVWLLRTGSALGGLVILPIAAVWVRHWAEDRQQLRRT